MLTETTVSKLREMRLSVMANALKDQLADPQFQNMTFEDRLGLSPRGRRALGLDAGVSRQGARADRDVEVRGNVGPLEDPRITLLS